MTEGSASSTGGGGFYNMIHGNRPWAGVLLHILNAAACGEGKPFNPGRFRDAWVEREGDWLAIRVHTRNGGGNRADQAGPILSMLCHPWYHRDSDMSFDTTYADFWFRVPIDEIRNFRPDIVQWLQLIAEDPVDVGARWQAAVDALRNS